MKDTGNTETLKAGRAFTEVIPGRDLDDEEIAQLVEIVERWKAIEPDSESSSSAEELDVEGILREGFEELQLPPDEHLIGEAADYIRRVAHANRNRDKMESAKWFLNRIPNTVGGFGLQFALFGPFMSYRAAAKTLGCDESSLREAERKFIRLLGLKILPRTQL